MSHVMWQNYKENLLKTFKGHSSNLTVKMKLDKQIKIQKVYNTILFILTKLKVVYLFSLQNFN